MNKKFFAISEGLKPKYRYNNGVKTFSADPKYGCGHSVCIYSEKIE